MDEETLKCMIRWAAQNHLPEGCEATYDEYFTLCKYHFDKGYQWDFDLVAPPVQKLHNMYASNERLNEIRDKFILFLKNETAVSNRFRLICSYPLHIEKYINKVHNINAEKEIQMV